MILDYAVEKGAIVISKDNYRDMFQVGYSTHFNVLQRVGWLVGWLDGWLVGWFGGWMVRLLGGWLVGW